MSNIYKKRKCSVSKRCLIYRTRDFVLHISRDWSDRDQTKAIFPPKCDHYWPNKIFPSHQWTKWHEQSPAVGSGQQKFEEKPHVHCALCTMCTGHWAGYRVQCACRGVIGPIKGRLFQLIHQTIWLKLARQDIFFLLHLIVNSQFSFLRVQLFSQWMWPAKRGKARQACWYQCGYQNQNDYKYWNGNAVWQRQTTRIIRATSIL